MKIKSILKYFVPAFIAIFMASCSSSVEGIKSADEISQSDSIGYLAVNFENTTGWNCAAVLEDSVTKKSFTVKLDKPSQQVNTINVLGFEVYRKTVGDPININITLVPLKPGRYKIKYIQVHRLRESYGGFGSKKIIEIKNKSITYVGKINPNIFILIFPWKFQLRAIDAYEEDVKYFENKINISKQITDFK